MKIETVLKIFSWRIIVKYFYSFGTLAIIILIFDLIKPGLLEQQTIITILRSAAPIVIMACAYTLVMISGEIDLSIGSILAFCGVGYGLLAQAGVPVWIALFLASGIGGILGLFNGMVVTKLKIPSVIATLTTMSVLRGISSILCGNDKYIKTGLPKDFSLFGRGEFLNLPIQFFIFLVVIIIFAVIMYKSLIGKYAIAVGANKTAAKLAGIKTNKIIIICFVLMGLASGLAGVLEASRFQIADPRAGLGRELTVITAVLLGGTSFKGGEGSLLSNVAGAFIISVLAIGMNRIDISPFYQQIFQGIILILAIIIDKVVKEKIIV